MGLSICNFDAEQLAILAPILAISLSRGLSADETGTLSAFLTSVADAMALLAIKQEAAEAGSSTD